MGERYNTGIRPGSASRPTQSIPTQQNIPTRSPWTNNQVEDGSWGQDQGNDGGWQVVDNWEEPTSARPTQRPRPTFQEPPTERPTFFQPPTERPTFFQPTSSQPSDFGRYTVRRRDSWWSIATRHNIPVEALRRMNPGVTLRPGITINVPARTSSTQGPVIGVDVGVSRSTSRITVAAPPSTARITSAPTLMNTQNSQPAGPLVRPDINPDQPANQARFYTVARGDTYFAVARKMFPGQSTARAAQAIQKQNNFVPLTPGLVIAIPRTI